MDRTVGQARRRLPERLATIRGDRSQRRFAKDLDIFQQNINRYEQGTAPHIDALMTIGLKEGVSLDWLLLGRGKMMASRRTATA